MTFSLSQFQLRTVLPLATAHTFSTSQVWSEISKFLKEFAYLKIQRSFYVVDDYVEKADLSKGYQNPKRKLGVTMHFSEIIIELKFGKKLPYILCILKLF